MALTNPVGPPPTTATSALLRWVIPDMTLPFPIRLEPHSVGGGT
jgi:hypothetical protein